MRTAQVAWIKGIKWISLTPLIADEE